jgi:hypothetical protein
MVFSQDIKGVKEKWFVRALDSLECTCVCVCLSICVCVYVCTYVYIVVFLYEAR